MLRCVALVRTHVSEERYLLHYLGDKNQRARNGSSNCQLKHTAKTCYNYLLTVISILAFLHSVRRLLVTANVVPSLPILVNPGGGGDMFLRNVSSYKGHMA
jgi:hypothetical protein